MLRVGRKRGTIVNFLRIRGIHFESSFPPSLRWISYEFGRVVILTSVGRVTDDGQWQLILINWIDDVCRPDLITWCRESEFRWSHWRFVILNHFRSGGSLVVHRSDYLLQFRSTAVITLISWLRLKVLDPFRPDDHFRSGGGMFLIQLGWMITLVPAAG